jgi:hypothetical protein
MIAADSVHSTPRRFTPKIVGGMTTNQRNLKLSVIPNKQILRRRTMPISPCSMIDPQSEHCPQPARMGVFANNAMRFGEGPRQRRIIGRCG